MSEIKIPTGDFANRAAAAILEDFIAPQILGLDPFQIEKAWDLMGLHAPGNCMAAP